MLAISSFLDFYRWHWGRGKKNREAASLNTFNSSTQPTKQETLVWWNELVDRRWVLQQVWVWLLSHWPSHLDQLFQHPTAWIPDQIADQIPDRIPSNLCHLWKSGLQHPEGGIPNRQVAPAKREEALLPPPVSEGSENDACPSLKGVLKAWHKTPFWKCIHYQRVLIKGIGFFFLLIPTGLMTPLQAWSWTISLGPLVPTHVACGQCLAHGRLW